MSSEMADLLLAETDEKMKKAVAHAKAEFASIRTGRAAPALVEKIPVDYYGSEVPLQQLAGFSVPEARQLLITPYDKGAMGAIEKAIQHSDLGLNPSNDGNSIRLSFPPLTQERRKELVRVVKQMAEDGPGRAAQPAPGRPATSSRGSRRTASCRATSWPGPRRSSTG